MALPGCFNYLWWAGRSGGLAIANESIGTEIRAYRDRRSLSIGELAQRLEVDPEDLEAWESDATVPPLVVRAGIRAILDEGGDGEVSTVPVPPAGWNGDEQFVLALDFAGIYAFTFDVAEDRVVRIGALKDMFGLASEDTASAFVDKVHPLDRPKLLSAGTARPAGAASATRPYRLRSVDGEWRWLQDIVTAATPHEPDGSQRVIGITLDVTERLRAEEAAEDSQRRLELAMEAGKLSLWDWDLATGKVLCSDGHFRLAGYEPGEVEPTKDVFVARIHPDDWPAVEAEIERSRRDRTTYGAAFRFVHPDGKEVHVEARGRWIVGENGEPERLIGVLRDVSEERADEARQRLLVREVDHRAKNMLAVVSAMISLSARGKQDVPSFVEAVQDRLEALRQVHDLIAANRWEGAGLREVVLAELAALSGGQGSAATIAGEDVELTPEASLALSMVLHELTTNAMKHGSLSEPDGRVAVSWDRTEAGGLDLLWSESGGPEVDPVTYRQGLGSQLIANGLGGRIGGRAELRFDPAGVTCRIHLPPTQIVGATEQPAPQPDDGGGDLPTDAQPNDDRIKVLLVEDDFLIALNTRSMLEAMGCDVIGPVGSVREALTVSRRTAPTVAVLDIKVGEDEVFPLAEELDERGIPFAFATGYSRAALGRPIVDRRLVLPKPYDQRRLRHTIESLIGRPLSGSP